MSFVFLAAGFAALAFVVLGRAEVARGRAVGFASILLFAGTRVQFDRLGWIVTALVALIIFAGYLRGGGRAWRFDVRWLLLALLWLSLVISDIFAGGLALQEILLVGLLSMSAALLAVRFTAMDGGAFRKSVILNGWVQLVLGLYEVLAGVPIWGYGLNRSGTSLFVQYNEILPIDVPRLEGGTGHSIVFGLAISLAIIAQWSVMRSRPAFVRVALAAPLVIGFLLSGSRSVLLAMLAAAAYLVFSKAGKVRWQWKVSVAIAGVGVLIGSASFLADTVREFTLTGSFTNRLESLNSIENLTQRPVFEVIIGSGYGSLDRLFDEGFLAQSTSFRVVDNLGVTLFAIGGVLSFLIFLALLIIGWVRSSYQNRALLLLFIVMSFSFDYIFWFSCMTVLSVLLLADGPRVRRERTGPEAGESVVVRKELRLVNVRR